MPPTAAILQAALFSGALSIALLVPFHSAHAQSPGAEPPLSEAPAEAPASGAEPATAETQSEPEAEPEAEPQAEPQAEPAPQVAAATTADPFAAALTIFVDAGFKETGAAIDALAATGDARAEAVLRALRSGDLYWREEDKRVVIGTKAPGRKIAAVDAATGEDLGAEKSRTFEKIRVNNSLRRQIDNALGSLTLLAKNPSTRLAAAEALFKSRDPSALPALEAALEKESDPAVRAAMAQARAGIIFLNDAAAPADRLLAADELRARADPSALSVLSGLESGAPAELVEAADAAKRSISAAIERWRYVETVWYGLSLGSVLMLAAIGLAITFGVMGVINMAHGELVMLGAYTTFVVQEAIRNSAPGLFDVSLLIAAPLAFAVAGLVGVAIERGVVRYLYGRPLETLLATWGVSLMLQQAVRVIFGPNNREVGNPSWMSGGFEIGLMTVTYNRLWILIFALAVFALLLLALKKTSFGLQMRAVTQNRAMARDMGIRTDWVDAMTFGLGAGVAGLAGVALSQIGNVSPNLGQSYIVDSFMVVVFGGAGNLWGALAGAFTLGIANKILEPFAGAVLAKILVLVFIILFIQRRPRGLFAIRGRAVEA